MKNYSDLAYGDNYDEAPFCDMQLNPVYNLYEVQKWGTTFTEMHNIDFFYSVRVTNHTLPLVANGDEITNDLTVFR